MGSYDEALRHFRRALQIEPDMGAAHYHIGSVYMLLKQMEQAAKEWEIAAKKEPTNADCMTNLGVAHYKNGRFDLAVSEFRRVITLRSNRMEDFSNLALSYAKQGMALRQQSRKPDDLKAKESQERSKIAIEMFDRALAMQPQNVMLHSNRGLACYFANRPEEAMVEWTAVSRIDPAYARRRGQRQQSEFDDTMIAFIPVDVSVRAMALPAKTSDYLSRYVPSYDVEEWSLILMEKELEAVPEMTRQARHLERLLNSL
jgi:tetratricopeptide (TPR) repeat protein